MRSCIILLTILILRVWCFRASLQASNRVPRWIRCKPSVFAGLAYVKRDEARSLKLRLKDPQKDDIDALIDQELQTNGRKRRATRNQSMSKAMNPRELINRAVFAGIFVAGIGTGITVDSAINTNPKDLASRDAIDRNAPNPKLCATYGSSAMVMDQRVFVTFNPFNVYVSQADTKPGCVLRPSNVVNLLKKERNLISDADIEACKNGFNTWAFVGDINSTPQLNCVFQSDDAQNEFLSDPKFGLGEDIYDPSAKSTVPAASRRGSKVMSKKIVLDSDS